MSTYAFSPSASTHTFFSSQFLLLRSRCDVMFAPRLGYLHTCQLLCYIFTSVYPSLSFSLAKPPLSPPSSPFISTWIYKHTLLYIIDSFSNFFPNQYIMTLKNRLLPLTKPGSGGPLSPPENKYFLNCRYYSSRSTLINNIQLCRHLC